MEIYIRAILVLSTAIVIIAFLKVFTERPKGIRENQIRLIIYQLEQDLIFYKKELKKVTNEKQSTDDGSCND